MTLLLPKSEERNLYLAGENIDPGTALFQAIDTLMKAGATKLKAEGKALSIPDEHRLAITKAFVKAYLDKSKQDDPIAKGNVGHMSDHLTLFAQNRDALESQGIDPESLLLAIVAHDTGKALLDADIERYLKEKTANSGGMAFLLQRVGGHEYHSIANIPKIVSDTLTKLGIDTQSPQGQNLVRQYSLEVIEAIRLHNGVGVLQNLREQYPSLSEDELKAVQNSWWAQFNRQFADVTGSSIHEYGETSSAPVSAIGQVLNLFDRMTLTSAKAPWKLGLQNSKAHPFGVQWVKNTFIAPANGNDPLILAQGEKVIRTLQNISPTDWAAIPQEKRRELIENHPLISQGLKMNDELRTLGNKIVEMNSPETLKQRLGQSADVLPSDKTQVLYWLSNRPSDPHYRVVVNENAPPSLQRLESGAWIGVFPTPGVKERKRKPNQFLPNDYSSPTHLLMALARNAGAWSATPP